jgi:hypothetical protein
MLRHVTRPRELRVYGEESPGNATLLGKCPILTPYHPAADTNTLLPFPLYIIGTTGRMRKHLKFTQHTSYNNSLWRLGQG